MATETFADDVPLPTNWPSNVRSAILQVISLARLAIIYTRSWASDSISSRVRLQASLDRSRNEVSLLQEEIRLKDARMAHLDARRRPHYRAVERLAILELKAARGWSAAQTARRFLVEPDTIASWMKRVDEDGPSALVQTSEPVNRFPSFVRHLVRRLKVLCPPLGKKRMAQMLARAGLHLGVTTVGRMLKEDDIPPPAKSGVLKEKRKARAYKPVKSKYPNHVWLVDLTVMPTSAGFWAAWFPFTVPQAWPWCWWIACVVDHFSRRVMGFAIFSEEPSSIETRRFVGRAIGRWGTVPKYLISDQGGQFTAPRFEKWCRRRNIQPRYAATGQRGATAVIERFFRSLKEEWLRCGVLPLRRDSMRRHVSLYLSWHLEFRPHQGLGGQTPKEVYEGRRPANKKARWEPRPKWPKDSPCASPQARVKKRQASRLGILVRFHEGSRQLPIVEVKRAA
jgi:putative transposase